MGLDRRKRLVEIAAQRELLVLEDNPYGMLRYEGEALPPLRVLDGGVYVMYLGTFSKILSPGLRLGWSVAPRPVLEKLNLGKQGSDLCSSPVTQLFVAEYFKERDAGGEPRWLGYLEQLKDLYRSRRDAMLEALAEHFGEGARWTQPQGGLFVWATLDERIDTTDLLAQARKSEGVAFVPGRAAYMDGRRGASSMRLNFAGVDEADIREGIRRIGKVVRQQLGLYGSLTGSGARAGAPAPGVSASAEAASESAEASNRGEADAQAGESPLADVVAFPRREQDGSARRLQDQ
jgi:2-aminoadipate transaminase